tara:strand:+ start:627 stop:1388 length:762 start_codon:yes stop_codon:yes gene_type:complete
MNFFDNYKQVKSKTPSERKLNLISYYVFRPLGFALTALIIKTKITPNQVTLLNFVITSISLFLIYISDFDETIFLFGFILYFFSHLVDNVDGSLARAKMLTSNYGRILDTVSDKFFDMLFIFLITIKLESIFHIYLMILFFSLNWSQVYVNTLIKYYKKNKDEDFKKIINLENKTINSQPISLNKFKFMLKRIFSIIDIFTLNLNIIVLFIFILFNLTSIYLLVFFLSKSFTILINIILVLKNNFIFLNRNNI